MIKRRLIIRISLQRKAALLSRQFVISSLKIELRQNVMRSSKPRLQCHCPSGGLDRFTKLCRTRIGSFLRKDLCFQVKKKWIIRFLHQFCAYRRQRLIWIILLYGRQSFSSRSKRLSRINRVRLLKIRLCVVVLRELDKQDAACHVKRRGLRFRLESGIDHVYANLKRLVIQGNVREVDI